MRWDDGTRRAHLRSAGRMDPIRYIRSLKTCLWFAVVHTTETHSDEGKLIIKLNHRFICAHIWSIPSIPQALIEKVDPFCEQFKLSNYTKAELHDRLLNPQPFSDYRIDQGKHVFVIYRSQNWHIRRYNSAKKDWDDISTISTDGTKPDDSILVCRDRIFVMGGRSSRGGSVSYQYPFCLAFKITFHPHLWIFFTISRTDPAKCLIWSHKLTKTFPIWTSLDDFLSR